MGIDRVNVFPAVAAKPAWRYLSCQSRNWGRTIAKRITAVVRHWRLSGDKMAKAGPKLGKDAPPELGRMGELIWLHEGRWTTDMPATGGNLAVERWGTCLANNDQCTQREQPNWGLA
jgi:hypothetical protein